MLKWWEVPFLSQICCVLMSSAWLVAHHKRRWLVILRSGEEVPCYSSTPVIFFHTVIKMTIWYLSLVTNTSRCLIQVRRGWRWIQHPHPHHTWDLLLWPHWINFMKFTHFVFTCFILRCVPFCILLNLKACRVSTNDICHLRHWLWSRHNTSIDDHSEPSGYCVYHQVEHYKMQHYVI